MLEQTNLSSDGGEGVSLGSALERECLTYLKVFETLMLFSFLTLSWWVDICSSERLSMLSALPVVSVFTASILTCTMQYLDLGMV